MATLTRADLVGLWKEWKRDGVGKHLIEALPNLPTTTQIHAAFQIIEDAEMGGVTIPQAAVGQTFPDVLHAQFDSALGQTTSNALFTQARRVWFRFRDRQGG